VKVLNFLQDVLIAKTSAQSENKKPSDSGKTGNEGIRRILTKTDHQAGSILLFAEKCSESFGTDERSQIGILTLASNLFPPSRPLRNSGIENCSHYSGATVPDSHRVPRHSTAICGIISAVSKNESVLRAIT
jgi:hypothetical protein